MEINLHMNENELLKMPIHIIKKRLEQLNKYLEDHPGICPLMASKK